MDFQVLQFLIPLVFFWYAYKLYVKKPAFGDERGGFPTRRARENEEIWAFVQRTAGIVCFVMAILQSIVAAVVTFVFPESQTAYWLQIAFEVLCMVALIPIVNWFTNKKYPEK